MTKFQSAVSIREGGYYRIRDGRKVGPMRRTIPMDGYDQEWVWTDGADAWREDGSFDGCRPENADESDIIAEWSPVQEVTRREILHGDYGTVHVGGHNGTLVIAIDPTPNPTRADLLSAASVLAQIAEALS